MTVTSAYRGAIRGTPARGARVVLVGGSGQVGTLLARSFHARGDEVCVLSRTTFSAPWRVMAWDGENRGSWVKALQGADVLVNLAGRSVNCRYHRWNRREILESRVRSTRLLGEAIGGLSDPPSVWLNASTATIYRHSLDRAMDEASGELGGDEKEAPEEWRFSIAVAKRWEETFFGAETPKTRKVALRSAITMSPDAGGAFDTLSRLVRFGLGGTSGSGEQFVSWIHERDFARAVDFLIENEEIEGVVNVASPNPVPNAEFMESLRKAWDVRFGLSAREWMLEVGAFLLRTETELILKSRRVVPGRLLRSGFRFEFPRWLEAATDLVKSMRMKRAGEKT
jgi:uncharacterized protein